MCQDIVALVNFNDTTMRALAQVGLDGTAHAAGSENLGPAFFASTKPFRIGLG